MGLSNTATPYYYGKFRDSVLNGDVPVCIEIEQQMNLIDDLIRDPKYYYDDRAVEGWIRFCESEMCLVDGSPVVLTDYFKLWAEDLLSWYEFVEHDVYDYETGEMKTIVKKQRLRNIQYLVVGRGAAKTLYLTYHQAYGLTIDGDTTSGITVAPTKDQAEEVLAPFRTAIYRHLGPVFRFMTNVHNPIKGNRNDMKLLAPIKEGVINRCTNSTLKVRPMSIDKLQGLRTKYNTLDEWLSGDTREDPIEAIEQGASKIDDYCIIAASSEGCVRDGIGDSIKMKNQKILRGDWVNPHVSIWHYKLDDVSEVGDPRMWIKANPGLGKTVTYETYKKEVDKAENSPSDRNDILAKRFGIPTEGLSYSFKYEATRCSKPFNVDGYECSLGIDLSLGDDFAAFLFLFPINRDTFALKARCYISEATYQSLNAATYEKYTRFIKEDSLVVMEGTILKDEDVYDDLDEFIAQHDYIVICVGYDPYNSTYIINRWEKENGSHAIVKVRQGFKTESVPLGELEKLSDNGGLIFDQEIISFCMGNAITLKDTNGNKKLYKKKRADKVDCVAACIDGLVSYKIYRDDFIT